MTDWHCTHTMCDCASGLQSNSRPFGVPSASGSAPVHQARPSPKLTVKAPSIGSTGVQCLAVGIVFQALPSLSSSGLQSTSLPGAISKPVSPAGGGSSQQRCHTQEAAFRRTPSLRPCTLPLKVRQAHMYAGELPSTSMDIGRAKQYCTVASKPTWPLHQQCENVLHSTFLASIKRWLDCNSNAVADGIAEPE